MARRATLCPGLMSCRTSMRVGPSSRIVPTASSAFATATSSSGRKTTVFSVSAYVAMDASRRPLYRIERRFRARSGPEAVLALLVALILAELDRLAVPETPHVHL